MNGFYIKELRVVGKNKKDAIITLEKGLNVITGPSNTGKSFIFQCIDYIFGSKNIKEIPEFKGYETIFLEIRLFSNDKPLTLIRKINDKYIYYYEGHAEEDNIKKEKLKAKHNADKEDNISKFLLKLIGIDEKKYLVTSQLGAKKTLSFRGIANLALIDEIKIVSDDKGPIVNLESTNDTYSKSIFRYLLTKEDDKECEEIEKNDIRKAKIDAKIEYIQNELELLKDEKNNLENKLDDIIYIEDVEGYEREIENLERILEEKQKKLKQDMEYQDKLNFKINKLSLMLDKFYILKKQYENDLRRIDFVETGSLCLSQIHIKHCPLCNNKIDLNEDNIESIVPACEKERENIKKYVAELNEAIVQNSIEKEEILKDMKEYEKKIEENTEKIQLILSTKLKPLKDIINNTISLSNLKDKIKNIEEKINTKQGEVIVFNEKKKEKQPKLNYDLDIPKEIKKEFCTSLKNTLIEWKYKNANDITFNDKGDDILINGIDRKANGKGYRAYFYSAFSVTLLNYLINKGQAYSRILMLDSPLTTLKEEKINNDEIEEDDIIDKTLQDSLFISLSETCEDKQIIIIENKKIPNSIKDKCNYIVFTKEIGEGRYGFFPPK